MDLINNWKKIAGMNSPMLPGQPSQATPPFAPPSRPTPKPEPHPPMAGAQNPVPPKFDFAGVPFPKVNADAALPEVQSRAGPKIGIDEILPEVQSQAGPKVDAEDEQMLSKWQGENMNQPWHKDANFMNELGGRLGNAFGSLTLRGNSPGDEKANMLKIAGAQQNRKRNKTMDHLIKNKPELAKAMMGMSPEMQDKYMGEMIKTELGTNKQFRTEVSTMRVDEKTGKMYYLESDGNGNQKIIYAKDDQGNPLYGDTGDARQKREIHTAGIAQARAAGGKFFEKSESLRSSLDTFKSARLALDKGARSGIIDSALPALDANTQNLRSLANTAGIEVINSATFGALSEKELSLAMSTGIPVNLPEDQLDDYLKAKIKAQEKLYSEIEKKAQQLNTGDKTLGEWQAYWGEEERPESYKDEYASRFGTGETDTSYKGWRSEKDEDDKPKRKKRWEFAD